MSQEEYSIKSLYECYLYVAPVVADPHQGSKLVQLDTQGSSLK